MPTDDPVQPIKPTDQNPNLEDLVAQSLFGYGSESDLFGRATRDMQANYRVVMSEIIRIFDKPDLILRNIEQNNLTPDQIALLDELVDGQDPTFTNAFLVEYLNSSQKAITDTTIDLTEEQVANIPNLDEALGGNNDDTFNALDNVTKKHGYLILYMLQKYQEYKESGEQAVQEMDPFDWLSNQLKRVGDGFEPNVDFLDVNSKMKQVMLRQMGKFRADRTPASVAPWQCRIGGSTFYVPPININVSQTFKTGSFGGAAIRQQNSPKFNSGHSETSIEMTLYFPNHETIWGFVGDKAHFNFDPVTTNSSDPEGSVVETSDEVVDFFLSSLRGLVTQFKYAPFLPVKNQYLNQSYDIQAVTLLGMSVSTLPDYPFCLAVTLQMAKFNHKVYMPMIDDFDQAIHWGKFRQYLGKAASRLDAVVNQGFLTSVEDPITDSNNSGAGYSSAPGADSVNRKAGDTILEYEGDQVARFDKIADISDGRYFDLYVPKATPARIFSPDTTDFRQPGEDAVMTSEKWDGILGMIGIKAVDKPQFQFNEYDTYFRDGRYTSERFLLQNWLQLQRLTWQNMGSEQLNDFVGPEVKRATDSGEVTPESAETYESQLKMAWFSEIYKSYLSDPVFQKKMELEKYKDGQYLVNEWKIPMEKISIDWSSCIVQGISVSLSNNIARLQVQMQDEPVHQHIGGGDSSVNVSMIVLGETNLIKLRRVFEHINSLARLEHGHGVLGFLGIKNVVTALCGIKYVLPLSFEVDTIPDYPHAYSVRMSFVDFDVFQQKREQLSSDQQKDLIEAFGKRNPFLRIKQRWGAFNAYPDMPLEVRDEEEKIVGHLDPDWYFRSFVNTDKDIYNWNSNVDLVSKLEAYTYLQKHPPKEDAQDYQYLLSARHQLEVDIRSIVDSGVELPDGYVINSSNEIVATGKAQTTPKDNTVPLRYYLGTLDENQENLYYVEMDQAGAVRLGSQNASTGKDNTASIPPHTFAEQNASQTLTTPSLAGTVPPSQHQNEYWNKSDNPTRQFELMMQDWNYRQIDGRMLRAFPTYMLWLIDEGGRFAGIKLFDNFYGLNSVVDFSVVQSEDSMDDTLVLRVSNLFSRLSTPFKDSMISQDDPLLDTPIGQVISTGENRNRNLLSGLTDQLVEINNIRLKPGVRVHLRAGYGANPNNLQTVFNGTITEVEQGDIMTIIAQSDTIELSAMVNTTNKKGHSGTIDGGINTGFWLSEPRDLMVRLLSMGSSSFKEWVAWGTQGTIFSENRFGIRHFGSILYEEMTKDEKVANTTRYGAVSAAISASKPGQGKSTTQSQFASSLGNLSQDLAQLDFGSFSAIFNTNMIAVMEAMWVNSFKKRDYELFKRNIYPGNGLGIAQYMAGDMIDAGAIVSSITSTLTKVDSSHTQTTGPYVPTAAEMAAQNKAIVDSSKSGLGLSPEDDTSLIGYINSNTFSSDGIELDTPYGRAADEASGGNVVTFGDVVSFGKSLLETTFDVAKYASPQYWLGKAIGWLDFPGADQIGWVVQMTDPIVAAGTLISVGSKLINSPLMQAFGVTSAIPDDDLRGYDEVSFRAQTYMKSVWDLFQLCAALLPNYIVAVRPFEDRSTIFYGKPHWLYTSGVIPVSNGVPKTAKPDIEVPDSDLESLKRYASQNLSSFEEFQRELADIGALNEKVATSYEAIYTSGAGGVASKEAINALPTEWDDGAFLPKTEGQASVEMHLPTRSEYSIGQTTIDDETDHKQLDGLPEEMRWPYYMDRNTGDGAGGLRPHVGSDGYVWDWGGGEDIVSATSGKSGKTIGNENPDAPGQQGAFGLLDPESEQWYISSFWPYETNTDVFTKVGWKEVADKASERGLRGSNYKDKRILVWSESTGIAVVCTPGDWGPFPGKAVGNVDDPVCGLSPDAAFTLGIKRGDKVQLRAMPDDTPLGPFAAGPVSEVPVGKIAPGAFSTTTGSDVQVGREKDTGKGTTTSSDTPQTTVNPYTGDTVVVTDTTNDSLDSWRRAVADQINQKIADLQNQKLGSRASSLANSNEMNSYVKAGQLLESDPIVFAYHFGWKFDSVPAYIDVNSGVGYDLAGDSTRQVYDTWGGDRSDEESIDIWEDFRKEFRLEQQAVDIYNRSFPQEQDTEKYNSVMDLFLRFMWQVPSNRAWLINNANRVADGFGTQAKDVVTLGLNNDGGMRWNWDNVYPVWQSFITSQDLTINEAGTPISPTASQYMTSNNKGGKDATNFVGAALENIQGWFDENIGSFISMVGDTITGVLSMIRLSMMQVGVGLNLAGTMQRQANILNSVFNDSIYYQMGTDHSLLRLIDNPFTREYGEPVVEIREPFQRIHFLSSFQHILNNSISENLNGVYTVVTATSDGKYPVTVHFDKGMSPEKQMEKSVDTGLFWDNTVGSGLTGMFQPLIHPIESLRSLSKDAAGSSDLLSSKRVGLWHLKESLKDIYTGELLVLGNTDVRPHDLIYLADVYERMYGMFEVEKVIHHFTPENGFVTSIVPNAIVTINDPARWSLIAWAWRKMSEHSIRSDTRAMLAVKADRNASMVSQGLMSEDIPNVYSTQLLGAMQYTQGNTALVRDFSAMYSMGGMTGLSRADEQTNQVDQIDQNLRLTKAGLTTAGIVTGGLTAIANPVAGAAVAAGAYVIGDLVWKAWEWVRDNLFDQHGCYIQYLNKDGQPMDAGLSYFQGVAVGQHHSISMFPSMLGITGTVNTVEDGHYRITSNDLMASLGWSEVETAFVQRETSWFVDQINAEVLKVSGRSPDPLVDKKSILLIADVLNPDGETLYAGGGQPGEEARVGVIDGDTLHVRIVKDVNGNFGGGTYETIRLASVNTPELKYKQYADTGFDETDLNLPDDLALLARNYLVAKFTPKLNRRVVIRVNAENMRDAYGRLIGVIFHNLPLGTQTNLSADKRGELLSTIASKEPVVSWDSYLEDGRPYTLNWELVMGGFGNVYLPDAIYNSTERQSQISDTDPVT